MKKKLRLARDFSKNVNSTYIITDLSKNKLNELHLLLLKTIARFISLREKDAIELVGESVVKLCYKNALINKVYFEMETFEKTLYDIKEIYSEEEIKPEIFYVLDFGGIAVLESFDKCRCDEIILPKMYLGTLDKYILNSNRYEFYKLLHEKNADFDFIVQPPPIYLFSNLLRFHAMLIIKRKTEIENTLLLGITFFDDNSFPTEKEKAGILTLYEQFFRGETIKKVCATYNMIEQDKNFFNLIICNNEKQLIRVATTVSLFSTKNSLDKFKFIVTNGEKYNMDTFKNDGKLLKFEAAEIRKLNHKFFPQ